MSHSDNHATFPELPTEIEDTYPLSPLQQGMLFHTLQESGVGMYISQAVSRHENLDVDAMRQAWQTIMERHPILRTSFHWDDPEHPVQRVHRKVELPFTVEDWRGNSPSEQGAKLRRFQREERERGFDLTKPALFRITAIQVSRTRWYLVNTHHHIILDGWSGGILAKEIGRCYEAFRQGRLPRLPEARPFGDYIRWIQQQDPNRPEQFWRKILRGLHSPTPLPMDKGLPAGQRQRTHVETWSIEFDTRQTRELTRLSKQCHVTLNTLVLASWAFLLARYSGRSSILFGFLVSGRPPALEGVESIVGMFLNTLPFRVDINPDQPLNEWLHDIQKRQIELQDYEHSSLMLVQQWSEMPGGVPLFGSIVARKDVTQAGKTGSRRAAARNKSDQSTFQQNYPLLLNITATGSLELKLTYDARRFESPDMARIMEQLRTLLISMTRNPEQPVGSLEMMSPEERLKVLVEWNNTSDLPVEAPTTLHQHFEQKALELPEKVALTCPGHSSLSYAEVNRRANQLTRYLADKGFKQHDLIAIYPDRSPQTPINLLAVMKLGATAVLLPTHKEQKEILDLIEQLGCTTLLLHSKDMVLLEGTAIPHLCPDQHHEILTLLSDNNFAASVQPEDPAYLLLRQEESTSVEVMAVSHRAALNRTTPPAETFDDATVFCVRYPEHTAIYHWELFSAWQAGKTAALLPYSPLHDPESLIDALSTSKASRIVISPTLLRELLNKEQLIKERLPHARHWLCTGEPISNEIWPRLQQIFPDAMLYNLFGCLESGNVTLHKFNPRQPGQERMLGKPLADIRGYVLDAEGQPCPIGITGELHLSGRNIVTPYPRLAQRFPHSRFRPNTIPEEKDETLLRTGDLVRWHADGRLEYLGQLDQQPNPSQPVDIAALETTLRNIPGVDQAAVLLPDHNEIIAWIAPVSLDFDAFCQAVTRALPVHFQPTGYVLVDALPLTPTGTLDYRAMRHSKRPIRDPHLPSATSLEPKTELEQLIHKVWKDVLNHPNISVEDNFFELGGHSLSATRVTSRLTKILQKDIPLRGIFEAPTIRELAAWIETGDHDDHLPYAIEVADRGKEVPLSFTQQQLWVLGQMFPDIPGYTIPSNIRFEGHLDIELLEQAILQIVDRHEILRSTFISRNGEPLMVIHPTPDSIPITVTDLSSLPKEKQAVEAKRVSRKQGRIPWDLELGPLMRPHVITLSPTEHIINTIFHHIIADGPSVGIYSRELEKIYSSLANGNGRPPRLPKLSLQYGDFTVWERENAKGPLFDKQLEYWRKALEGAVPLEVPTDFPRPAVHKFYGEKIKFQIPKEALLQAKAVAREEQATLFMCVLAIFQLLLSRYSGRQDVMVGSAMTNRIRTELEPLIGLFVNTIPLRTDLSGDLTFRQLLRRVKNTCLGAFANMDLPFEETVRVLQPDRDLSRQGSPLFQYMIINQPPGRGHKKRSTGFKPGESHNDTGFSNFDILLSTHEILDQRIDCTLAYDLELFTRNTIERFIERYALLFHKAFSEPDRPISQLSLLSDSELQQLLKEWNGKPVTYPPRLVHELIREQVQQEPDKVALVYEDRKMTYAQLESQSNRLAHYLLERGIKKETLVAVCLERSISLIVALLGILKAGGAFVTLDPSYPKERLRHILRDSASPLIIGDKDFDQTLLEGLEEVEVMDINSKSIESMSNSAPHVEIDSSQLAYVIFTSGSTGLPKGVMVEHHNLADIVRAQCETFGIQRNSRVLQMLSLSFDAGLGEVFRTLTAGATLYMAHRDLLLPGRALVDLLKKHRITTVAMSPTALGSMPDAQDRLKDLNTIIVGGEPCPPNVAEKWGKNRNLINGYGPTETTIGATVAKNWDLKARQPLGRPLPGVKTYVLDETGQLVPTGVIGELYIGGIGVTRGYLNQPELTAERFLSDPFSDTPNARMYRTGDLVRWRADGNLEFIGRADQQVKIRGFRIELGEIETALSAHPAVDQAVVEVYENNGNKRLVAYLVFKEGNQIDVSEIRNFIKERLPEYMVPALFINLPKMPMTANGKIDRKALPEPDFSEALAQQTYIAPKTPLECQLAELWSNVLGIQKIGMKDNFFELGGDSISSIRFAARANEQNLEVDPKDVFLYQTLEELAPVLEERFSLSE